MARLYNCYNFCYNFFSINKNKLDSYFLIKDYDSSILTHVIFYTFSSTFNFFIVFATII